MFHITVYSVYFIVFVLQQKPNPVYADLAVTKSKKGPIPPAPEDVVVYAKLMEKEQVSQNVEETFGNQNPVSHRIPTPEDNQNDIPPPVAARILSQNSPQRTPPIPPTNTPTFPPTESLPVEMENRSSQKEIHVVNPRLQIPQVSQSGVEV